MKTLVLGGNSGIGEAVVDMLQVMPGSMVGELYVPLAPNAHVWSRQSQQTPLDVRDETSVSAYLREFGPFDYIVYTVGKARLEWASQLMMDDYVDDFTVNAFGFGTLLGNHKYIFPDAKFSAVAVVSDAWRNPMRGSTTYCASKAALVAIIKNLAREWAPDCRVNGVAPAIVHDTPMTNYIDRQVPDFRGWDPEKADAYEKSLLPMGRRVNKEEVARVLIDVLTGPAYLTGSIVDITGGK